MGREALKSKRYEVRYFVVNKKKKTNLGDGNRWEADGKRDPSEDGDRLGKKPM